MSRIFLVSLQAFVLALAGLAVGVHAVPFTVQGFVGMPSRLQAGIFILSKMPFDGMPFLHVLGTLVWIPVITAAVALFQNFPALRSLRWLGFVVNLSALGYLVHVYPTLFSPGRMPAVLFGTAGLFGVNAVLTFLLPRQFNRKGTQAFSAFLLAVLCFASLAVLVPSAVRQVLSPQGWAGFAGCLAGMGMSFYCLIRVVNGGASRKSGESGLFIFIPAVVLGVFALFSPPLALPVAGGLLIVLAGRLP